VEHRNLVKLIQAAHADRPVELVLAGAPVLNVFAGELLVPGLIDAHKREKIAGKGSAFCPKSGEFLSPGAAFVQYL
jgi:hypothetical protein